MNTYLALQKDNKFIPIKKLNDAEYEEYDRAIECLAYFSSELQLFTIVNLNYKDYKNVLNQYFEDFTNLPSTHISQMEHINLNINRHIMNFLSSASIYLAHHETNLKKRNGKNSKKVKLFEETCSNAYDNHFSYRFIYKLRNYTQHFGVPVGEISFKESLATDSSDIHHYLEVKFNRDELLKYDKWGEKLKSEIQELPDTFEITPHITVMMKCIGKINFTLIEDDLPNLINSAEYVKQLITEIKDKTGTPYICRYEKLNGNKVKMHLEHIPFHLLNIIDNIRDENSLDESS